MGMVRKVLAWLTVPVLCLVGLLFYIMRPFNADNNRLLGLALARTGRAILGIRRPLLGSENFPLDRSTVVIANHQHNDDLFIMADLLPPRTVTVGKAALAWVPFFGQIFWLGGNVLLDRKKAEKAVTMMKEAGLAINRDNKSLWVFPEGTRSRGRGLAEFKKGAFHAAVAAQAPITMVCAQPYSDRARGLLGRRSPVTVHVLPPVETAGKGVEDIPALVAECREKMETAIHELTQTPGIPSR